MDDRSEWTVRSKKYLLGTEGDTVDLALLRFKRLCSTYMLQFLAKDRNQFKPKRKLKEELHEAISYCTY